MFIVMVQVQRRCYNNNYNTYSGYGNLIDGYNYSASGYGRVRKVFGIGRWNVAEHTN